MPYKDPARKKANAHERYLLNRADESWLMARRAYRVANLEQRRAYVDSHRARINETKRLLYAANPEKFRKLARDWEVAHPGYDLAYQRRLKYGVSVEWVAEMLDAQEGQCAICDETITARASVDHDHDTGVARALLCNRCNLRLHAIEDVEWRERADSYLELHRFAPSAGSTAGRAAPAGHVVDPAVRASAPAGAPSVPLGRRS